MDIRDEIVSQLNKLPLEMQQQVLRFLATLTASASKGESGAGLRPFAGTLDPLSATEMTQAIEEECERVDVAEW
jgi:hypothetical protein